MKKTIVSLLFTLCLPLFLEGKSTNNLQRVKKEPSLLMPTVATFSTLGLGFALWTQVNPRISLFEEVSFARYARNITQAPRWDHDRMEFNFWGHPAWGAETYLLARNQGFNWFVSFLFSTGASVMWEYGFEAFAERPSFQDLILTPVIGAAIGEIRFQVRKYFQALHRARPFWLSGVMIVALDPVDSFVGLFRLKDPRVEQKVSLQVDLNPKLDADKIVFEPKVQLNYFF